MKELNFSTNKFPTLMGILNVTPDSFSDGGKYLDSVSALEHAQTMINHGASIIDLGAQSTGPGSSPVSAREEISRLENIVPSLAKQTFLSIDTYHAETASFCLSLGAKMINDISALRADAEMVNILQKHGSYVVMMFSKESGEHPNVSSNVVVFNNILDNIISFFEERIEFALKNGIAQSKIILDPGMGAFLGTDPSYSWEVLSKLNLLKEKFSEFPILIGTSRKGFLGGDVSERDPLSNLLSLGAFLKGADIVRTHNVKMAFEFHTAWNKVFE